MQEEDADQQQHEASIEVPVEFEGECPSLTGRSTLTYQIGRHPQAADEGPLFRISDNSGKGMWCKEWASVAAIDALLAKATDISARTLNDVHPNRSINTGGFYLAVLKDLGVVNLKEESRHHERVPGATLAQAIALKLKEASAPEKQRKSKAG